jgi:hypothetical protein
MVRVAAAFALLMLQQPPSEFDVVTLKDGTTRTGRILSETAGEIVLETLIKGSKGQVVGSAKQTIDKANVVKVERASEEARKKAADRSTAFSERGVRRAEALAKLRPLPVDLEGAKGVQITGTHFILESTCDIAFAKDVAVCLEDVFGAYRKSFDVRRNADRKVKVYVLADRDEYVRFQERRHGESILNAAYYHAGENYIAAFNMIQREEERRIRQEIVQLERAIEIYKADLSAEGGRVDGAARDIRRRIQEAAAEERRAIRADGAGAKEVRIQQVDRRERELLEELRKREGEAQKDISESRRKATEAIEANRKIIERNERVLASQNRTMFEMLFHEGFHAFAANHLWEGSAKAEFPRWLHEGMASYFEMSVVEGGELIHGAPHPAFHKLYREKAILNALVPLEQVLGGGPDQFLVTHRSQAARSSAYYAQSWALSHYLASRATRDQIAAYVGEVLAGQDGVKAFEKMLGKSCREAEADLRRHIEGLKTP